MSVASSARLQADFAAALLDPALPLPAGLRAWNGADPARRFAVHRNNVTASLVAAMGAAFPVVRRLVGGPFFDAMASLYVREQPPSSPVLAEYGDGFADWVAAFGPARALPYLCDMARLERARVRAFHAPDARALDVVEIAARLADPESLPHARPVLHPSCSVLVSAFAVATLWAVHQAPAEDEMPTMAVDAPGAVLVLRDPADEVLVIPLSTAAGIFCRALHGGEPLGAAAASARASATPDAPGGPGSFDLCDALAILIGHGAFVAWPAVGADA